MHDILSSEGDDDMLYHERTGPEPTHQVWNLNDEDIDTDFLTIPGQPPSVDVNPSQGLREHMNSVLQWILLFLCWSSFCVISDNALEILLEFFELFLTLWPQLFFLLEVLQHYSPNPCIY